MHLNIYFGDVYVMLLVHFNLKLGKYKINLISGGPFAVNYW